MSATPPSFQGRRSVAVWWMILALLLVLVGAVAVVGVRWVLGVAPSEPAPRFTPVDPPPTASVPATPFRSPPSFDPAAPVVLRSGGGPLLAGAGAGQLYAQSATGIYRINLGTGTVVRTATARLEEHGSFVAGPAWVIFKSRWSALGVLVRDGQPAKTLPRLFDAQGYLHLGPDGRLWQQPEGDPEPVPDILIRLADVGGRLDSRRSIAVPASAGPYSIDADGRGGLLLTNPRGIYRLDPSSPAHPSRVRLLSRGDLIGVGARGVLVWDCDSRARCHLAMQRRQSRHRTVLPAAARTLTDISGGIIDSNSYGDSQLSPDGTHLAVTVSDRGGKFRVHVIELATGRDAALPGAGPEANVNRHLAWSPNSRWLFALTDERLRGFDTRSRSTQTITLANEPLLHLTAPHASGW